MPELRIFHRTWDDRRWHEGLQRLTPSAQFVLKNSLRSLLESLVACRDPKLDGGLQRWSPSRWDVPRVQATKGEWIEYRLGDDDNRGRVIVCYDRKDQAVYLVARTAIHDHGSLRELVARFS